MNIKDENKSIYIAFDIDGTIYDAANIIEESFERAVDIFISRNRGMNLKSPTKAEIRNTLGLTLKDIFITLFPEVDEPGRGMLSIICNDELVKMIRDKKGELIKGADEIIPELHSAGYKMLVASNGAKEYCEAILDTYGLLGYFSEPFLYPGEEHENKTEVVRHYLENISDVKNMVMIGDRFTDLEAARENLIPFIGCAFGHAGIEEIKDEKHLVYEFHEIVPTLERMEL